MRVGHRIPSLSALFTKMSLGVGGSGNFYFLLWASREERQVPDVLWGWGQRERERALGAAHVMSLGFGDGDAGMRRLGG